MSNDLRHINFCSDNFSVHVSACVQWFKRHQFFSNLLHFMWPCVHMCPMIWDTSISFQKIFQFMCLHVSNDLRDTNFFQTYFFSCDYVSTCVQWFETPQIFSKHFSVHVAACVQWFETHQFFSNLFQFMWPSVHMCPMILDT